MENIRTAMNRGAFDFVTKPIDFVDLETTIEKALREIEALKSANRAREQLIQILQFLTEGRFHPKDGVFRAPSRQENYYVESNHLESSLYRAFTSDDLF